MLHPSTSIGTSLHMLAYDQSKVNPGHLYVRQPHTIQIIQLVEGPPPPRRISSVIESSSASSSSASSCPSTSDSEAECSSYCSSIVTPDESSHDREPAPWTDDTYDTRMKRVYDWRDGFTQATNSRTSPLKRKVTQHQADDDVSHCSKRSRSRDGHSIPRLIGYPCPACDTPFPTPQSLRKHGCTDDVSEACRVAVEYNFE
ncbi:hypothetical protein PAXRUDRAFT_146071 [Paxillus rubicundulus Ve08.2h10]|uniref:Uncharacterized protein n=1 Tax=Paxillus rubicundulus Ve08.2h10 TaxID=930991 RepID=A0A0D0D7X2_9AGAM|nr:hypothetical protein PAXRUDRAFT_146071 [Paxillus rubicundulus Ve08.2h10]